MLKQGMLALLAMQMGMSMALSAKGDDYLLDDEPDLKPRRERSNSIRRLDDRRQEPAAKSSSLKKLLANKGRQ